MSQQDSNGGVVCPKCLSINSSGSAFCADCGAPIGVVSNIDPLQRIQAEGFAYRSAVEGPPRLVVVFGIWLLFAPIVIGAAIMLAYALSEDLGQTISAGFTAFFLLFSVGLAVLLYRTAKKNIAKSREAGEAEDNRVIDLGNWVFIAPTLMIAVAIVLYLFSDTILSAAVFLILMLPTVCSVVVIYRTTKNFIVKSRAANKGNYILDSCYCVGIFLLMSTKTALQTKGEIDIPDTLFEALNFFNEGDNAFSFLVRMRWPNEVHCPQCDATDARFIPARKIWECRHCATRKQFSVKVGTIFEDSPISFAKWMSAFWLIANAKNGISSCELHRALGVTQKTAWFMLQRIRLALQNGSIVKIGGHVEADETFIGGKARNMHKGKRKAQGTGPVAMTPVMGLLERTTGKQASRVVLKVVDTTRKAELQGQVRQYVLKGSEVHTDALKSYEGLADEYTHNVIDHAVSYVRGHVHTNGLENFWSLLKRTIKGTYVSVEPFHLFRYLDEQAFRFNERKDKAGDKGRFLTAIAGIIGKRLTYKKLIGQDAACVPA